MDLTSISLALGLICLILWIIHRYYSSENIFTEAGIPYSGRFASLYGLKNVFSKPMHELLLQGYKKNGKLYGQFLLGRPQLNVADPDMIKQVLVKDFQNFVDRMDITTGNDRFDNVLSILRGETWKRVRTVMSPGFSTGKIKKMTDVILDCAETLKQNVDAAATSGEPVDIKKYCGAFTMDAIASSAFGTKVDSHNDPDNQFILAAKEVFSTSSMIRIFLIIIFNKVVKLLRLKPNNLFGSRFFGTMTLQLAEQRKSSGEVRNDFLQMLIDALEANNESQVNGVDKKKENEKLQDNLIEGENDITEKDDVSNGKTSNPYQVRKVLKNEDELVAQCILFFIGGYETVASTVCFTLYELAMNENCQDTLIAEIDEMMKNEGKQKLTYEGIQSLKYLDGVVSETLRMYPPAPNLQRIATTDCTLGDSNIRIPKGTLISIPTYPMHYDPQYFPDPEKFDPNRFSPEEKASRNPYVYLPFGAGPRNCIAMRFALFEVKLCLVYLLLHFRFHRCPKTQVPPKIPPGGQTTVTEMFLSVEKRQSLMSGR